MKIKDIINEGWWDVAKRFGTDLAGGDVNVGATRDKLSKWTGGKVAPTASPAAQRAFYTDYDKLTPKHQGEIFVVKIGNQEFFKSYRGRWYRRDSTTLANKEVFTLNSPLDSYAQYEKLDNALLANGFRIVPVKGEGDNPNHFTGKGPGRIISAEQAAEMSKTEEPQPGQEQQSTLIDPSTGKPFTE